MKGRYHTTALTKAVFIDRDGVLIEEAGNVHRMDQLRFIPGAIEALEALAGSGRFRIIIMTEQPGIAHGYFSELDYHLFTDQMLYVLSKRGVRVDAVYYCPHHPSAAVARYRIECDCRKPGTGMIVKAASEYALELRDSWLIGDKTSDIRAGSDAGVKTIMVRTGYGGADSSCAAMPDYIADDLMAAVKLIERTCPRDFLWPEFG
ncbi:MAG: HAD family hydrolase [Deltaproteobacteria bacterium]|nr:HAD family hydrolase [Deltaproteobacteria bacterium]